MQLKSLDFYDYKSFPRFTISAKSSNILVGANNAGKSTSLDALRIAFDVLRYARRRTSVLKSQGADGVCATWFVPQSSIQLDMRYCVHNFADDTRAKIELTANNGNKFAIALDPNSDVECYLASEVGPQKRAQFLRDQFPLDIVVVPTLSPLEQNEELVQPETVERNRYGRLASRNFRNFWLNKTKEEFEVFADLVEQGWPGIRVMRPELERGERNFVRMYFRDGPNVREVQWSGFGFQVWMQTMMHLTQSDQNSILVLDEPDIYLHPDLQHRLLRLVSSRVDQFFIATHSTEIINAADPGDVLIVRPTARSARRIRNNDESYSAVYAAIGSSENAQFARLARTRKVLYFEGADNRLLSKLSKSVGAVDYLSGAAVTLMKTDGFSNWGRVSTTAWVFKEFFELDVQVAALFDRDYRSDAEVKQFEEAMAEKGACCFVLPFKEIENVLLCTRAIKAVVVRYANGNLEEKLASIDDEFERLTSKCRDEVFGQRMGHHLQYQLRKNPHLDTPTLSTAFQKEFSSDWERPDFKLAVVPGKKVFSDISRFVQETLGVTITPSRVIDELSASEIHASLLKILADFGTYFGVRLNG